MILCDTNILIEFKRTTLLLFVSELRKIGVSEIAISIVTSGELIYGAFIV